MTRIKISFIGIDKKTNINELIRLQNMYHNIEFGVLVSESTTNTNTNNRYPNLVFLQQFKNKNLNLSLHVCGRLANNIAKTGSLEELKNYMGSYFDLFQRIQINIVGATVKELITDTMGKEIIIQTNLDIEKSKATFEKYKEANLSNIIFLSDKSGGRGEVTDFDYFETEYQGFAGGLNPENICERKEEIDILCDYDYWLDMESGVRTNDWFDIAKVEDICKKIFN